MDRGKSKMNVEDLFITLDELNFSKEDLIEIREKLKLFKDREAVRLPLTEGKAAGQTEVQESEQQRGSPRAAK